MAEEQQGATGEEVQAEGQTEPASTEQTKPDEQPKMVSEKDVRALQSSLDRQVSQRNREISELKAEMQKLRLQSVPEEERETAELRATIDRQTDELANYQRLSVLNDMSSRYGVPADLLANAESPQQAQQITMDYMAQQMAAGKGAPTQASPSPQAATQQHQPFVSPAQPGKSSERDFTRELEEAFKGGDPLAYTRLLREAKEAGAA